MSKVYCQQLIQLAYNKMVDADYALMCAHNYVRDAAVIAQKQKEYDEAVFHYERGQHQLKVQWGYEFPVGDKPITIRRIRT
jgi:hypothetical protein